MSSFFLRGRGTSRDGRRKRTKPEKKEKVVNPSIVEWFRVMVAFQKVKGQADKKLRPSALNEEIASDSDTEK